jgi:hypothetical protein
MNAFDDDLALNPHIPVVGTKKYKVTSPQDCFRAFHHCRTWHPTAYPHKAADLASAVCVPRVRWPKSVPTELVFDSAAFSNKYAKRTWSKRDGSRRRNQLMILVLFTADVERMGFT